MKQLILPDALAAELRRQARAALPRECCGLIEGIWDGDAARAMQLHPAANLAADPDRFEIAPDDHLAALKAARARGQALIGCYHSHPNGKAEPSARDLEGAGEENFLWLIAAVRAGAVELAAFAYFPEGFGKIGLATGADLVTSSLKRRN